ncbi:unnamed protein product [Paramecium sonneborni]|uniref:Uncharacterized protein n=1 Tax=Paramecium sonneborni TaxID=65129 RepID=A0A8S1PYP0_9CILI|nr:unnamed protein product [Paramecium sonneborni]
MFSKNDGDYEQEFKKQSNLFVFDSCSISHVSEQEDSMGIPYQFEAWNPPNIGKEQKQAGEQNEQNEENKETEKLENLKYQKREDALPITHSIGKIKQKKVKNQEEISDQQIQKKGVYMLPGESKNIPKNFTRALKHFIITNFDTNVLLNPEIKKFLSTKPEKACKQTLENSIKNSQLLQQISQMFYGNILWGNIFLEENKVELEPYFRFNKVWFNTKK